MVRKLFLVALEVIYCNIFLTSSSICPAFVPYRRVIVAFSFLFLTSVLVQNLRRGSTAGPLLSATGVPIPRKKSNRTNPILTLYLLN